MEPQPEKLQRPRVEALDEILGVPFEVLDDGRTRMLVAVADVDALVTQGGAIDEQAGSNTTSVYTGVRTFPMLPERLSHDLTSLNPDADRAAPLGNPGKIDGADLVTK